MSIALVPSAPVCHLFDVGNEIVSLSGTGTDKLELFLAVLQRRSDRLPRCFCRELPDHLWRHWRLHSMIPGIFLPKSRSLYQKPDISDFSRARALRAKEQGLLEYNCGTSADSSSFWDTVGVRRMPVARASWIVKTCRR